MNSLENCKEKLKMLGCGRSRFQYQFPGVIAVHAEVEQDLSDPGEDDAGLHHAPVDPVQEQDHHGQTGKREERVEPERGEEGDLGGGGVIDPVQGSHCCTYWYEGEDESPSERPGFCVWNNFGQSPLERLQILTSHLLQTWHFYSWQMIWKSIMIQ